MNSAENSQRIQLVWPLLTPYCFKNTSTVNCTIWAW